MEPLLKHLYSSTWIQGGHRTDSQDLQHTLKCSFPLLARTLAPEPQNAECVLGDTATILRPSWHKEANSPIRLCNRPSSSG